MSVGVESGGDVAVVVDVGEGKAVAGSVGVKVAMGIRGVKVARSVGAGVGLGGSP
jgi:hypothetical protein